jgi:hypothetical protein
VSTPGSGARLALAGAVGIALGTEARAQAPEPAERRVLLVNVLDEDGHRVEGLTAASFRGPDRPRADAPTLFQDTLDEGRDGRDGGLWWRDRTANDCGVSVSSTRGSSPPGSRSGPADPPGPLPPPSLGMTGYRVSLRYLIRWGWSASTPSRRFRSAS